MSQLFIIALLMILIPLLSLIPIGLLWLWQAGVLFIWAGFTVFAVMVGFILLQWLKKRRKPVQRLPQVKADPRWPGSSGEAWHLVEAIRDNIDVKNFALNEYQPMLELGIEVIEQISRYYYPRSKRAELEMPIPYALKIIEMVSRDLRDMLDTIPFSHVLSIHDLVRGQKVIDLAGKSMKLYRAGRLLFNPTQTALQEIQARLTKETMSYPADDLKKWLLHSYVEKIGYYAIALYSGELTLDGDNVTETETKVSKRDLERTEKETTAKPEPLRILVLGQLNAGKSSLINTLFGELQAPVDMLPLTEGFTPYSLQREGLEQALILDTEGYQDAEVSLSKETLKEISNCDLILLVCNATTAARKTDRQYLEVLREFFREHPDRRQPPVLVVLSHIDQLRPVREWQPPYNIVQPDGVKAENIRQALEVVATDLDIAKEDIVPANLDLENLYNIEEGIIPAVLSRLDEAKQSRYLRCLRHTQKAEYWWHLMEQGRRMGTILIEKGSVIKDLLSKGKP